MKTSLMPEKTYIYTIKLSGDSGLCDTSSHGMPSNEFESDINQKLNHIMDNSPFNTGGIVGLKDSTVNTKEGAPVAGQFTSTITIKTTASDGRKNHWSSLKDILCQKLKTMIVEEKLENHRSNRLSKEELEEAITFNAEVKMPNNRSII